MINQSFMFVLLIGLILTGRLAVAQMDLLDDTKSRGHSQMSPSQAAEAAKIGKLLDALYSDCGRYPLTKEGLSALVSKPKTLKCKKWGVKEDGHTEPYSISEPAGWKYVSENGTSYTIEPSK